MRFNSFEVLEMAKKIERNGAAFYRRAAELHPAEDHKKFLERLADMEDEHERMFAELQAGVPESQREETSYDPYAENTLYLASMADMHGGEGTPSVADSLTGAESMEEILRTAMDLERRSILFYLGIRDMVPDALGKDRVMKVIDEEKSHVAILAREIRAIRTAG